MLDVKSVSHEHFLKAPVISAIATKIQQKNLDEKKTILQMLPLLLSYTNELRIVSRYGIVNEQLPRVTPEEIFSKDYATSVLKDAETLSNLLFKVERKGRWLPKIKIGILNGYVSSKKEVHCKATFANQDPSYWEKQLKETPIPDEEFEITQINASEIDEKFAIIINPFGEAYPEYDIKGKPIFFLIKDYIENGGVYVNTGGFPFFYAWDVSAQVDNSKPICDKIVMIPKEVKLQGETVAVSNFQEYLEFTGTLLFKEFNALPTPQSKKRKIIQNADDISNFGDLTSTVPREIDEFRAMPKNIDCIPIVRAQDDTSTEVYPICALKRGRGYLLLAGMNTTDAIESELFSRAITGFCKWIIKQL